jgi:competence protein ComEA
MFTTQERRFLAGCLVVFSLAMGIWGVRYQVRAVQVARAMAAQQQEVWPPPAPKHSTRTGAVAASAPVVPTGPATVVDINVASLAELEELPGIGPALAQRILDSRHNDGPFRSLEDLLRVKGIGPATLQRLAPFVALSGVEKEASQ